MASEGRTGAAVYIVDDDASVRNALARMFNSYGLTVVAFATAEEFWQYQRENVPGCLVLDVRMPGQSGLELQEQLARHDIDLPIVFLTGFGDIPMTVKAMRSGAAGFLTKPVDERELLQAVHLAIEQYVRGQHESKAQRDFRRRLDLLSHREREVMDLVICGMPNKLIARRLGITEHTVKVHRGRAMAKAGVESIAELVRLCERSGILPGNE